METQAYYDEFAGWYERERGRGYHRMLDDLEVDLVERYGRGASVLEAGCGTGLLLARIASFAGEAYGADLSAGMLLPARQRGLKVVQGSVTALPFPDERFDVVCSFKVLAHVEAIREALGELARVTRRGGHLLLEFYNPLSLRYLAKVTKPAARISEQTTDHAVYTRWDTLGDIEELLPQGVRIATLRGVRIVTPVPQIHKVPVLGPLVARLEHALADVPVLRRLGGFLVVVAQRQ